MRRRGSANAANTSGDLNTSRIMDDDEAEKYDMAIASKPMDIPMSQLVSTSLAKDVFSLCTSCTLHVQYMFVIIVVL